MRSRWLGLAVVLALTGFVVWAWPQLPERMAVHWGASFRPDGWSSKGVGAALFPGLALAIWLGLPLLRTIDPKRENYARWQPTFWLVLNIVLLMLSAVEVAVIGYNLGWPVEMRQVILCLIGLTFVGLGNYLPKVRPNWFVGIRTPWSLSSDAVWRGTHRLGGRTMVLGGLIMVAAAFAPEPVASPVGMAALGLAIGVPVVYSYVLWRRETRAGAGM